MPQSSVSIKACCDWRLTDSAFAAAFQLPGKGQHADILRKQHPFPREERVEFEEHTHQYFIDGLLCPRSVTALLHSFAQLFQADAAIAAMKRRSDWPQKKMTFQAAGVDADSNDEIIAYWDAKSRLARMRGTLLHFHAEQVANGMHIEEPHSPELSQVLLLLQYFKEQMSWNVCRAEINIFHCGLRCAGQPDLLCREAASGELVIVDWKRVCKVDFDNAFETLRYPLQHIPQASYWLYALQLNLYKYILETEYNEKVASMWLAMVHPNLKVPKLVCVPSMAAEVDAIIHFERENGRASVNRNLHDRFEL